MKLTTTITLARRSLTRNRVRTSLTIAGMVIGTAAVIVVFSAGSGIRSLVIDQVNSFGTDVVQTEIKVPTGKRGSEADQQSSFAIAQGVQITTLTLDDMAAINQLPNISHSYASILNQDRVSYRNELRRTLLYGTTADFIRIDATEVAEGRFFTENEDQSLARVAVLGKNIKEKLFGESDALGEYITIHTTKFLVIGVMEERGAVFTLDFDDMVYVPIQTLQKRLMGIDHVLYMFHQMENPDRAEVTAADIRALLRERHNVTDPTRDDFRVTTMTEALDILTTTTNTITLLLLVIVAVSLVVGGVGIMNIMYVVVNERTAEIGLRKAVGARERDILLQFLMEAVAITLFGGIIGSILGSLTSYGIALAATSYGFDWPFTIPWYAFVVALGFSAAFGIGFGIYPARRAARLDPIEALRRE